MDESDGSGAFSARLPDLVMPFDLDTELGRDLAAVDWPHTGVGPWEQWPATLVSTVRLTTASRFAMWMAWGPDLTFFCNDAYRRDTLGAKYPWALGKPAAEVWSEIWPDIAPLVERVVTEGESTWDERLLLFLQRSGYTEETYHTFSYSPIRGDDGAIAGLLCVVSEDTARVIGDRRIALLRDLGAALAGAATLDEVGYGAQRQIATDPFDLPFALTYLFDEATGRAELQWATGMPPGSITAPLVIRPEDSTELWHGALFGNQGITDLTAVPGLPTGGRPDPPVQALSVPLQRIGDREPYGYLVAGLNRYRRLDDDYRGFLELLANQLSAAIARARAFEAERERVEQLAELDRAKTTFFTNVSHELRTPLTLLLGPTEDALSDPDHELDAAQRRRVEIVQRNGERLLKLVNTLLDFSRLESGRVEAVHEQLDLTHYTIELASMFESAYARSGLTLTIVCEPLPTRPYVDREMWAKIVLNLLSNALKATLHGGVTVQLSDHGDHAQLTVADTGVGIPPEEQERLFERFHRVSGVSLRTHEGSGIGLALVAELARLHGGSVSVESEVGVGSTFRVTLPYGRTHLSDARVVDRVVDDVPETARYSAGYLAEALRWLAAEDTAPDPAPRPAGTLARVLVVDDNADMREYVQNLLQDSYAVETAPDGAAALALIKAAPPDLVLTDVMMPVLDGFGLLSAIRADPAITHLPVVMLSARSGDDATVEGLEAGADDYLIKPFSARELLARVKANLELDRVRRLVTELERSRQLLDNAEGLAHIGSWEIDLRAQTVRMSPELCRILGYPPAEVTTARLDAILDAVDLDDRVTFEQALELTTTEGKRMDLEMGGQRAGGGRFLVRVRAVVVPDETGEPIFVRGSTQDISEQRAAELELAAAHADREAAAREHAIATELQQNLLPKPAFLADQLDIAVFYRAGVEGTQVGGDWYDAIDLHDGRTALVIGDVMGRGVRAAAVMGQLRAAVRAYARLDLAPAELIRVLDDTVREVSEDTIVTCVYAVYDPGEQTLVYANAGHLPPLVALPDGPTRRLTAGGPPLGAGQHGEISETVELPEGATLVLYTDGLVERRGSDLDKGIERLAALVPGPQTPLADVPGVLATELLPDGPDDDVAILACRPTDEAADDRVARHDIETGTGALSAARAFAGRVLESWGVDEGIAFDVKIAVSELVTNAIAHGARPIQLRLRKQRDHLLVEIRDSGAGVPSLRRAAPADVNGRGLLIVSSVADRWGVRSGPAGKTVWCQFRITGEGAEGVDGAPASHIA
jgi:PAS domain S-box-containing protein